MLLLGPSLTLPSVVDPKVVVVVVDTVVVPGCVKGIWDTAAVETVVSIGVLVALVVVVVGLRVVGL